MRRLPLLLVMLFAAPSPGIAEQAAYSDLDLTACEVERVFEEGGGAELRCPGLGDVPVFVSEGDLRFDVDFGASNGRFESFAPFNSLGSRIEWRLNDSVPFAAILRSRIEMPSDDPGSSQAGQVLVVSKVGTVSNPGCPVAYIDALLNAQANLLARQAADAFVRSFRCGVDQPTYLGITGPLSGNATAAQ